MAQMKRGANHTCRMLVDHAMAAVLLALMVTPFEWGLAHEWLGMALFALFVAHQVLNRAWWKALGRGRWTIRRVVGTVVDLAMVACMAGLAVSSLVLSRYVLAWMPALPGAAWARLAHLACSYWLFVLAYAHAGAHLHLNSGDRRWQVALAVAFVLGVAESARLGMPAYMTLATPFVVVDSATPLAVIVLRYLLVACGCMALGCVGQITSEARCSFRTDNL